MTSTTYVARTALTVPATDANTRTSASMTYTHAVISKETGTAFTWHLTEAAARKSSSKYADRTTVVAVEAHQGGKATVLRRLAAEAEALANDVALHGSAQPLDGPLDYVATETAAEAPAVRTARTWDASTTTTHTCAGACGQDLPATSYPTTGKPGHRGVVCRKDRDAARTARTA